MTKELRKELIKIAHSYDVKCRFLKRIKIPYVAVEKRMIFLAKDNTMTKRSVLSAFFHEVGHMVDFDNGLFKPYYKLYPTRKALKRLALRAEIHTDETGSKLMRKHFPNTAFEYTYKYKKWQKLLKEHWGI